MSFDYQNIIYHMLYAANVISVIIMLIGAALLVRKIRTTPSLLILAGALMTLLAMVAVPVFVRVLPVDGGPNHASVQWPVVVAGDSPPRPEHPDATAGLKHTLHLSLERSWG